MIKLTVLVVTYNQEQYVRNSLDSIISQNLNFDYEVIIGDDCSTDNTPAILAEYAAKYPFIHVYHHPNNMGHVGNWEFCLNHCHGEYIAILEGDDYWLDAHKLQKQVDHLDTHPEVALTVTNIKPVYEQGAIRRSFEFETMGEHTWKRDEVCGKGWYILSSSSMFRNVFQNFVFPKEIHIADSYLFPYLLDVTTGLTYVFPEQMTAYRQHPNNVSAKSSLSGDIRLADQYHFLSKRFIWEKEGCKRSEDMYLTRLSRAIFPGFLKYRWRYLLFHPNKLFSRYIIKTIMDWIKYIKKTY